MDELSEWDDASELDWLPQILPPFTKIVLSTGPASTHFVGHHQITSIYPISSSTKHLEIPALTEADSDLLLRTLQNYDRRSLTDRQFELLIQKCRSSRMPLYISIVWKLVAKKWTSHTTKINSVLKAIEHETVPGVFEDALDSIEVSLGRVFVARALGYITASRRGLSKLELADVLSCDDEVMNEVYQVQL